MERLSIIFLLKSLTLNSDYIVMNQCKMCNQIFLNCAILSKILNDQSRVHLYTLKPGHGWFTWNKSFLTQPLLVRHSLVQRTIVSKHINMYLFQDSIYTAVKITCSSNPFRHSNTIAFCNMGRLLQVFVQMSVSQGCMPWSFHLKMSFSVLVQRPSISLLFYIEKSVCIFIPVCYTKRLM